MSREGMLRSAAGRRKYLERVPAGCIAHKTGVTLHNVAPVLYEQFSQKFNFYL